MARTDKTACNVSSEAQSGKEEDERPEFTWANPAKRTVWPFRQERQDNEGHHRKSDARLQPHIVDPLHQRVQSRFLDQQQGDERNSPTCKPDRSHAGKYARGQHHEGRHLCRAVNVPATARDVGCGNDRDSPGKQDGRGSRDAGVPQPSAEPAHGSRAW